ncbi:CBS domain-containing protein [Mesobacillus persicus]|uniref:CBS domain-containing protein n=1 Tax=Mesobacillus persicus TaxID=930146 RepID=A0A1H8CJI3_9BACI|nr:CBS domain-containing protein [Mesobacillus persicus]SEM94584.1 CBS domain-containing protein [Mesobacillus persicus]
MEKKKTERTQSGQFEVAFNRIHRCLKDMVKDAHNDSFVELLNTGFKNHSIIRKYKNELYQFAKLRNAIVHEKVDTDYYIAEPHRQVVNRIESIAANFEKPPLAMSISSTPVFYYYEDAFLKDVLKAINKFDFTRFPIYNKNYEYQGLLTASDIIRWMAKQLNSNVISLENVQVNQLLRTNKKYYVDFIKESTNLFEVEELFDQYHAEDKKLQAVILSENGGPNSKPKAILTPWDLLDPDPKGND